jgi:hypothetical protein
MKPDDKPDELNPPRIAEKPPGSNPIPKLSGRGTRKPSPRDGRRFCGERCSARDHGEVRTNIKRQQLKEDRTKSFLLLAGLTVVLSLAFFAMFSTPNTGRKDTARVDHPNLGRGQSGAATDTSRSVTPLLNADTRRPDDNAAVTSVPRTSTIRRSSGRWRKPGLRLGLRRSHQRPHPPRQTTL